MDGDKARIALCFANPVDQELLCRFVAEIGHEAVPGLDEAADCDLIFVDAAAARAHAEKVVEWKNNSRWFLPVVVGIKAAAASSPWLAAGFDDVLRLPCAKEELKARLTIMLRLRRQSEQLSRRSEYLHRALIESSEDHIFVLDQNGRYISSNNRVAHFNLALGEELVGKSLEEVFPPEVAALYRQKLDSVLTTGKTLVFEHDLPSTGGLHYHMDTLYVITSAAGEKLVGGICRDITARKKAEKELVTSEKRFRGVIENTGTAMLIVDKDGSIAYANDECGDTTGYDPAELMGRNWREFVHPDELPRMEEYFRLRFIEPDLAPKRYETRLVNKTSGTRNALLTIDTVPDTTQIVVSMMDITDLKQAEEIIKETSSNLKSVLDNRKDSIWALDRDYNYIIFNQAYADIILKEQGVKLKKGMNALTFHPKEVLEFWKSKFELAFSGETVRFEFMHRLGGEERYFEVFLNPIVTDNVITGASALSMDITERKLAEQQIEQDLKEKSALIQEIYHRTKNNMAVIAAMLSMEAKRSKNNQVKSTFRDVVNKIQTMSLVHQKLYQAKDLSNINLKSYIVDLTNLITRSYGILTEKIVLNLEMQDMGIAIDSAIPLGLIINELISNIIKHAFPKNHAGEIRIRLFKDKENKINLELSDNGVGFPKNFDPRKHGSMGLVSVFSIVENQLKGEITVKSENGVKYYIKIKEDENRE